MQRVDPFRLALVVAPTLSTRVREKNYTVRKRGVKTQVFPLRNLRSENDLVVHALPVLTSGSVPGSARFVQLFARHLSVNLVQDMLDHLTALRCLQGLPPRAELGQ